MKSGRWLVRIHSATIWSRYLAVSLIAFLFSVPAFATATLSYHGRIINPDGTYFEPNSSTIRVQIRSTGAEDCLMYEETYSNVDMTSTKGVFSVKLGAGVGTRTDGSGLTFAQVFTNYPASITVPLANCTGGSNSISVTASSHRVVRMLFKSTAMASFEETPDLALSFVPFAMDAQRVGGYAPSNLLRVEDGTGPQTATALTPANFTELLALINGTSTQYATSSGGASSVSAGAGTAGSPSISFSGDTNTGLYSSGADQIGVSVGGTQIFNYSSTSFASITTGGGTVTSSNGTAAAPTFSFTGDTDTGWYRPAADTMAAATAATERVRIDSSGNVGIGTASPAKRLHVAAPGDYTGQIIADAPTGQYSAFGLYTNGSKSWSIYNHPGASDTLYFNNSSGTESFTITQGGKVALAGTYPNYDISLSGNTSQNVGMNRHTTADTAGNDLYIFSGGATSGATNKNGGNLAFYSGTSTGTGSSDISFYTSAAGSTGTTDNAGAVRMTIKGSGNVGIGTTSPGTALDVAGAITSRPYGTSTGNTGQLILRELAAGGTNTATIRAPDAIAADYVLTLPADDGNSGEVLTTNGSGVLSWATAGSTLASNSLDFDKLEDTLDLDGALILNQSTNTWTQNYTGTTGTGFAYNANSLTSGTAMAVGSSSMTTGSLLTLTNSNNNASSTGAVQKITVSGTSAAAVPLMITNAGTGNSIRINDDGTDADTTPFVVDASGNVGVGTATPSATLETVLTSNAARSTNLRVRNAGVGVSTAASIGFNYSGTLNVDPAYISAPYEAANGAALVFATGGTPSINTDGTEAMRITSDGNVGIGTSVPQENLSVRKSGSASLGVGTLGSAGTDQTQVALMTKLDTGNSGTLGQANVKGWTMFGRGDQWSTASNQNDLGFAYWNGSGWKGSLYMDSATGNVGVGQENPNARLSIYLGNDPGDSTATTYAYGYYAGNLPSDVLPFSQQSTFENATLGAAVYGNFYSTLLTGTTSSPSAVYNFYSRPYMMGSGSLANVQGFTIDPYFWGASASGTIDYYYGLNLSGGAYGGGATGSVTNHTQLAVRNSGMPSTNKTGIWIDNITGGSGSNYAIYSSGGASYFAGNIGIGSTVPAQKLDVSGGNIQTDNYLLVKSWPGYGTGSFSIWHDGAGGSGSGAGVERTYLAATGGSNNINIDNSGNVGMGADSLDRTKLYVSNSGTTTTGNSLIGVYSESYHTPSGAGDQNNYGGYFYANHNSSTAQTGWVTGVRGDAYYNGTGTIESVHGAKTVSVNNSSGTVDDAAGLYSFVRNGSTGSINYATGFVGYVSNEVAGGTITTAIGVSADVIKTAGTITNAYGLLINNVQGTNKWSVYASDAAAPSYFAGSVGIGSTTPQHALDVSGNVRATNFISTSDARLKKNIQTTEGLDTVLQLRGVEYDWKKTGTHEHGVIAQEVEKVIPDAVATDGEGFKAVKYQNFIAPLIEAVKQLYAKLLGVEEKQEEQARGLASVTDKVQKLESENAKLKQENAAIKSYICSKDPKASLCQ